MNESASPLDFRQIFSHRHVVFPVIHVATYDQAIRNAEVAFDAGADGVFLINHSVSSAEFLEIHSQVTSQLAGRWIGVNCLDLEPVDVFGQITPRADGVWTDNAEIDEASMPQPKAQEVVEARDETGFSGLYFGGVAYQRRVDNLRAAAAKAADYMDVVTTSGPGTGQAAHVEKIAVMKDALGERPLAIASGITPDNVTDYLPCSDAYLVATGIGKSFEEFDPILTRKLIDIVRTYDG